MHKTRMLIIAAIALMLTTPLMAQGSSEGYSNQYGCSEPWALGITDSRNPVIRTQYGSLRLDGSICYKHWNGFFIEGIAEGTFLITDPSGNTALVFSSWAPVDDGYGFSSALELWGDGVDALIFLGSRIPALESFEMVEPTLVITARRLSQWTEGQLEDLGFSTRWLRNADGIGFKDGRITFYETHQRPHRPDRWKQDCRPVQYEASITDVMKGTLTTLNNPF